MNQILEFTKYLHRYHSLDVVPGDRDDNRVRALKPKHGKHAASLQSYFLTFRFSFVIAVFSWVLDF